MSDHYVESKISEALKATNGDGKDAVKLLLTWAVRDQVLLLGLTKPDLKHIIEQRINESHRHTGKQSSHAGHEKTAKDAIVFAPGKGEKRHPSKIPPPKSSERQASVMHQIVAAFKKK